MAEPVDRGVAAAGAGVPGPDAVTTKMTRGELAQARLRPLEWAPSREH